MSINVYRKQGHKAPALLGAFEDQASADACQASHEQCAGDPPAYECYQEEAAPKAAPNA